MKTWNPEELQGLVDMPNDEYHAAPGVSNSHLKEIARSPLHYWERYINPEREPEKRTPALILGDALHSAILEPDLFASNFAAEPAVDRRTKAGKAAYADFEAENLGKTILSAADHQTCLAVRDAVRGDPAAAPLLKAGKAEQSFFTVDNDTGELIKCRPDWMPDGHPLIVDLKSAEDASPGGFGRAAARYGYYGQAPWYTDILMKLFGSEVHFAFLVFEKVPPYACAIYYVEADLLELGRRRNRQLLRRIAACRRDGHWPGYSLAPMPLALPGYAMKELEQEGDQ